MNDRRSLLSQGFRCLLWGWHDWILFSDWLYGNLLSQSFWPFAQLRLLLLDLNSLNFLRARWIRWEQVVGALILNLSPSDLVAVQHTLLFNHCLGHSPWGLIALADAARAHLMFPLGLICQNGFYLRNASDLGPLFDWWVALVMLDNLSDLGRVDYRWLHEGLGLRFFALCSPFLSLAQVWGLTDDILHYPVKF